MTKQQEEVTDNTDTTTTPKNGMTQVKTVYARVAVILLALQLGFTGYIVKQMMQMQSESVAAPRGDVMRNSPQQAVDATVPSAESLPQDAKENE